MKKWFNYLFCVLCLSFTLTGCGGADTATTDTAAPAASDTDSSDTKHADGEDHAHDEEKPAE